ncbi:hypothetical protein SAMN04488037_1195 [Shimia marina]|uniref:Uncharacterized protein n=1 Tax=Shimia marina TaxID=321267 RepID=A0A0P1FDJ1_9RHOB|nr:hypothetical protein SHM7688_02120 [Shimia marina]SFE74997.1 hypothetical protein SAMN04488037_1195 [Shimia marina]
MLPMLRLNLHAKAGPSLGRKSSQPFRKLHSAMADTAPCATLACLFLIGSSCFRPISRLKVPTGSLPEVLWAQSVLAN